MVESGRIFRVGFPPAPPTPGVARKRSLVLLRAGDGSPAAPGRWLALADAYDQGARKTPSSTPAAMR
jgi:hypothetical protein